MRFQLQDSSYLPLKSRVDPCDSTDPRVMAADGMGSALLLSSYRYSHALVLYGYSTVLVQSGWTWTTRVMINARGAHVAATCRRAISLRYVINVSRESIHGRLPSSLCIAITPLSPYIHPTSTNITTMSAPEPTGVRQRGAPLEEHKNPYVISHPRTPRLKPSHKHPASAHHD